MKTRVEEIAVGAKIKVQITSAEGVSWAYAAYGSFLTDIPWNPRPQYVGSLDKTGVMAALTRADKQTLSLHIQLPLTADARLAIVYDPTDPNFSAIMKRIETYCLQSTSDQVKLVMKVVRVNVRRLVKITVVKRAKKVR